MKKIFTTEFDEMLWNDIKEENGNISDDNIAYIYDDIISEDLTMLKSELDFEYKKPIICIADLGFWNGRTGGYKIISHNLNDCIAGGYLSGDSSITYYIDEQKDLRAKEAHHDGTHYYLYRVFKANVSQSRMDWFCDKVYSNTITEEDVKTYTKSVGKDVLRLLGYTKTKKIA